MARRVPKKKIQLALTLDEGRPPRPPERIRDGYEAPPPTHRDAWEPEHLAADRMAPSVKVLREKVYELAIGSGVHGITAWEAFERVGHPHEPTVRPRLSELTKERHGCLLRRTRLRRPNGRGFTEGVYVAARHWSDELHADVQDPEK